MNSETVLVELDVPAGAPTLEARARRVRAAIDQHCDFLCRCLRRLGVHDSHVEDALQQVLIVFAQRLEDVEPGAERAFLFGTAVKVASDHRKKRHRSVEVFDANALDLCESVDPSAERLVDEKRARHILDLVLAELPEELRIVFVLFELEELTMAVIADLLGVPAGTVASRLRRARAIVEGAAARIVRRRSKP